MATYILFLRQIISNLLPLCEGSVRSTADRLGFQQLWMQKATKKAKSKAKPKAQGLASDRLDALTLLAPVASLPIQAHVAESPAPMPLQDVTHLPVELPSATTVPAGSGSEAPPAEIVNANEHLPSLRVDSSSTAAVPAGSGSGAPPAESVNENGHLPSLPVDSSSAETRPAESGTAAPPAVVENANEAQAEQSGMLPSNARDLIDANRERARQRREARLSLETSPSALANTVLEASQATQAEVLADHGVESAGASGNATSEALICLV